MKIAAAIETHKNVPQASFNVNASTINKKNKIDFYDSRKKQKNGLKKFWFLPPKMRIRTFIFEILFFALTNESKPTPDWPNNLSYTILYQLIRSSLFVYICTKMISCNEVVLE